MTCRLPAVERVHSRDPVIWHQASAGSGGSQGFPVRAALSTQPAETSVPSSMPMSCADRSAGTFPYADSSTAAVRSGPARRTRCPRAGPAAAPRTCPSRSTGTQGPAAAIRSPSGGSRRRRPAPTADPRPPRRPGPACRPGIPPAAPRSSSRPDPDPVAGLSLVTGLATPFAVLTALPLGLLPRPPRLLRPDPLLRGGRPRIGAVHRQPALQLRDPQLPPRLLAGHPGLI